jgi:hypothetical protein
MMVHGLYKSLTKHNTNNKTNRKMNFLAISRGIPVINGIQKKSKTLDYFQHYRNQYSIFKYKHALLYSSKGRAARIWPKKARVSYVLELTISIFKIKLLKSETLVILFQKVSHASQLTFFLMVKASQKKLTEQNKLPKVI